MKTSRISIYRRAIRQWKTFMCTTIDYFLMKICLMIVLCHQEYAPMERSCLRKSFHRWQIYGRKVLTWRLVVSRMFVAVRNSHARTAFSWWKYFATRLKTNETKLLQQNRLLQNLASSKKYRMMNKMLNRWIIYIKWILKRNAALRSMLVIKVFR